MAQFSDHFSKVASGYSTYRPSYPAELFDALADVNGAESAKDAVVWDCAAGSGQASLALADRFGHVVATDASVAQLASAPRHANVSYVAGRAESCPLRTGSVTLVTVAQALHWFQFDAFYAEVKRVLRPDGLIAVWSYGLLRVDANRELEAAVDHFSDVTLKGWWPRERQYVNDSYKTLPFPFRAVSFPAQNMTASWTREQLAGYIRTWSSVSKKRTADGVDPVVAFEPILEQVWGDVSSVTIRWPLTVLIGRA